MASNCTICCLKFKKAPSNRGLRLVDACRYGVVAIIQKSPIKSGIKTLVGDFQVRHFAIQKSPIKSGIKTQLYASWLILHLIQKSPIKSGIKTFVSRAAFLPRG